MKETAFLGGCLTLIIGFMLVTVAALSIGGFALGYAWDWYIAPLKGAQEARQTIQGDGGFRITAYTKFYNDCASIQALEFDLDLQISRLAVSTTDNEKRIVNDSIVGIGAARAGAVSRYNIDSHKQWTIAQFKSNALAYELPTAPYVTLNALTGEWKTGAKTICVLS